MFTKALRAIASLTSRFSTFFDNLKMFVPILQGLVMEAEEPAGIFWASLTPSQQVLLMRHDARVSVTESGVFVSVRGEFSGDVGQFKMLAFHLHQRLGVASMTIKSPSSRAGFVMRGAHVEKRSDLQ